VILAVALLLYRPPLSRGALLAGFSCFALLFSPLLLFEAQHGFPNAHNLLLWGQKALSGSDLQPFWRTVWRGLRVPFLLPQQLATALPHGTFLSIFAVIQWAELVVLGCGLLALGVRLVRAKDRRPYLLLTLWFALPFIIFPHLKIILPWYYFDVLYPAQFLMMGLLAQLWRDIWSATRSSWRPQHWLRFAMYGLMGTFVVTQGWFAMSFDRAVKQSGVLRGDGGEANVNAPPNFSLPAETMLLRFQLALATLFLSEFGVGHPALEHVAHGAVYQQFREDKGVSFLMVSPRKVPSHPDLTLHYVLLRGKAAAPRGQGQEVRSGPYRILAYYPAIQYDSWKWSVNPRPGWQGEAFDDSAWKRQSLPVRQVPDPSAHGPIPFTPWPGKTVTFRGWLEVSSSEQRVWLILNIRDFFWAPHTVSALYINGQPLDWVHTIAYDTFTSRNIEVMVDMTSALQPGPNLIAFQITGPNGVFDLDVYELQRASNEVDDIKLNVQ
jgi:hypothetical protein